MDLLILAQDPAASSGGGVPTEAWIGLATLILSGVGAYIGKAFTFLGKQFESLVSGLQDGTLIHRDINEILKLAEGLLDGMNRTVALQEKYIDGLTAMAKKDQS